MRFQSMICPEYEDDLHASSYSMEKNQAGTFHTPNNRPIDLHTSGTPARHQRYPPYYSPNYIFPEAPPPRQSTSDQMLSSILESQKQVKTLVEDVSSRLGKLEKEVSDIKMKPIEESSERKRLPSQLSVNMKLFSFTMSCIMPICGKW